MKAPVRAPGSSARGCLADIGLAFRRPLGLAPCAHPVRPGSSWATARPALEGFASHPLGPPSTRRDPHSCIFFLACSTPPPRPGQSLSRMRSQTLEFPPSLPLPLGLTWMLLFRGPPPQAGGGPRLLAAEGFLVAAATQANWGGRCLRGGARRAP